MTEPGARRGSDVVIDDPSLLSVAQRLRFLAKDSLLYGGAAAFNKAFALITFPLLARHFTVQDYGNIDYFIVLGAMLTVLFVFGQDSAVARFFYEYKDTESRKALISESLGLQCTLLVLLLPPAWLFSERLASRLSETTHAPALLKLIILQVPFLLLINFSQNILKWTFARARFLLVSIGSTTVSVGAILLGVIALNFGIVGVMAIYFASQAIFGIVGLWFIRGWLTVPRRIQFIKPMIAFAFPLGIVCVIAASIPALERTLTMRFLGPEELGLLAAGAKVALLIGLPIRAFQVAWGPFSLAIYKEGDAGRTYNWVLKTFAVGILASVMVLSMIAEPILHFLAGNRYAGASVVVFAFSFALAVEATGWITSIGISLSKRSYLNLYSYAIFLVVSLVSMIALLRMFGLAGVAWGSMIGYLAKTLTESWLAQRAYPLPWAYSGVVTLGLFTIGIGIMTQSLAWSKGPMPAALAGAAGLVAVLTAGWFLVFEQRDRMRILDALAQLRRRN